MLLSIKNLSASIEGKKIINNLSLDIKKGEIHAIMGQNGSGKSTLSNVLAGKEDYKITSDQVKFGGMDLLNLDIEERSHHGLFLAFQYPIEIPGVTINSFLRTALNSKLKSEGLEEVDPLKFTKDLKAIASNLDIPHTMLSRSVNEGFSGGEKKKFEILQMSILKPKLSILDETDSGLDVDAFKIVTNGINNLKNSDTSYLIITHYKRLLDEVVPDFVHILHEGKIIKSGNISLAAEIEDNGYKNIVGS
tara:strand:+ start:651 stop:1397 length:747 start_codon:yes stop_codon:yes gene_type:complete